jgi:hypothetical protein
MQVIYMCTSTHRSWLSVQRVKHRDLFMDVSTQLEDPKRILLSSMEDNVIGPAPLKFM